MPMRSSPFRTLCLIYGIAVTVGVGEFLVRRGQPPKEVEIYGDRAWDFPQAVARLYPRSAEAEYAEGRKRESLAGRNVPPDVVRRHPEQFLAQLKTDLSQAASHYEEALRLGLKSDENLIYNYALTLIRTQRSPEDIDRAIAQWRKNFPHSIKRDLSERRRTIEADLRRLSKQTDQSRIESAPNGAVAPASFTKFNSITKLNAALSNVHVQETVEWRVVPGYVGSDACRECHQTEFESYQTTPHGSAMSEVNSSDEPEGATLDHPTSGRRYRIQRTDKRFEIVESLLLEDGTEYPTTCLPMKYRVGSGKFARTYLAELQQGFLIESPVSWFQSIQGWKMTPGFDKRDQKSFTRPVLENCLLCHCGQVQTSQTNQFRLRVIETAIGCERCHGPGESHIQARRALAERTRDEIINPQRLSRQQTESICQQCHLQGEIQVGGMHRRAADFRPGQQLSEYRTVFRFGDITENMTVVGHVEQLKQSACYQKSDTMTCVTCHQPHRTRDSAAGAVSFQATCLKCHQDADCGLEPKRRMDESGNNCLTCHMPKSLTEVPHLAFTHHRIGIHQPVKQADLKSQSHSPNQAEIVPITDLSELPAAERERATMLARIQAMLIQGHGFRDTPTGLAWEAEVRKWLHNQPDPDVEIRFSQIQFLIYSARLDEAESLALALLDHPELRSEELAGLLQFLVAQELGRNEFILARNHLLRLTQLRLNGLDWLQLGQLDAKEGRWEHARNVLEVARILLPANVQVAESLLQTLQVQHNKLKEDQVKDTISRLKRQHSSLEQLP